jgi:hypothetical protein
MTELTGLAFLLCSRAKDKRLADEEILWLVEQTLERMEGMEPRRNLDLAVIIA